MVRWRPLVTGKNYVGARKYLFVAKGTLDGRQH
jgi:hypothetical protein